jgi:peptidoglycan/xylan/chitin deacetylase (PgdA/CDA1 family)
MRKLLFICAGLTACCLALWLIFFTRTIPDPPVQAEEIVWAATEQPPAPPPIVADEAPPQPESLGPSEENEPTQWETPPLLALTFDDGPSKNYTPLLLDGLRERGVHVTFFMLGVWAEKSPQIVLQAYEDGHALGGHSYDHRTRFTKLSAYSLKTQIKKTDDIIAGITGDEPPFLLRPPYGAINETVAQKTGKAIILWNIDPRDWAVRDSEKVYNFIMERAADGGVVILHDLYETSVEGALKAIDDLLAEGWIFVTIPELYEAHGITLQAGGIYRAPDSCVPPEGD